MKKSDHEYTEKRLDQLQDEMIKAEKSAWMLPRCPKCNGVLSQLIFTHKQVCLKCGSTWALGWCGKEK
jgi:ribosomal protein S27E